MTSDAPTLSITVLTEEREEVVVASRRAGPRDWTRLVVPLPPGLHQIAIDGKRGGFGASGISIDDVQVMTCRALLGEWLLSSLLAN